MQACPPMPAQPAGATECDANPTPRRVAHDANNTGRPLRNAVLKRPKTTPQCCAKKTAGTKNKNETADWTGHIHAPCAGDCASNMDPRPSADSSDTQEPLAPRTSPITREPLKSRKALEGHNTTTSGWVQEPSSAMRKHCLDEKVNTVAEVNFVMRPCEPTCLAQEQDTDGALVNALGVLTWTRTNNSIYGKVK